MIADILKTAESKMQGTIEHVKEELGGIRTGRAHPAMFNKIMVDYYGSPTPLQQLATFQVPEARVVLISPFDRGSMNDIEKAIRDSDLGVNPANDGQHIRLVLPQLTEERRKEYIKLARHKAEEARIAVRSNRHHANVATTTATSPTPTAIAAGRSRPADRFCGGGAAASVIRPRSVPLPWP